ERQAADWSDLDGRRGRRLPRRDSSRRRETNEGGDDDQTLQQRLTAAHVSARGHAAGTGAAPSTPYIACKGVPNRSSGSSIACRLNFPRNDGLRPVGASSPITRPSSVKCSSLNS